jgi:hypothetical protein
MPSFELPELPQPAISLAYVTGEIQHRTGRIEPRGPRHVKHVATRRSGVKFDWSLTDHARSPHRQIAHGRAWTQWGGWRSAQRALRAELDRIEAKRAGLRDRLAHDDGGCE